MVRNTRSCTPCSAMLNKPTPRPVSKPTPHATASRSVGAGASGSTSGSTSGSPKSGSDTPSELEPGSVGLGADPGAGAERSLSAARAMGDERRSGRTRAGARCVAARRARHPARAEKTTRPDTSRAGMGSADPDVDATAHDAARAWGVGASPARRAHAEACGAATSARMPAVSRRAVWRASARMRSREAERAETRVECHASNLIARR